MKFNNGIYDIIVPTSMGIRITPFEREPVHTSELFKIQVTSAESNVITPGASLGLRTKVLTAFVKGSPIARQIQNDLRKRNIEYDGPELDQGGPWGLRHQINIADSGFGLRAPKVQNDRAGEVGRELSVEYFDLEKLFIQDGVKLVHISGLIAALSPGSGQFCLEIARKAKESGSKISFDLNHRASFWKSRETELSAVFKEIAELSDILIGNEEDFQLALGIEGPKAGGDDLNAKIKNFKEMIQVVEKKYPNAQIVATTLREVVSANEHLWGAIMKTEKGFLVELPRQIQVHDRIGGGDGFVGGLLYGILSGKTYEQAFQFGWANGALTATLLNDYSQPMDEEEVMSVYQGNARVRR